MTYPTNLACGRSQMQCQLFFRSGAVGALLIASPAFAEVADKEPFLCTVWAWALALNVTAFVLELVRPRLGLLVLPFAAFIAWGAHDELSDPYVGPAILTELGRDYMWSWYASVTVGLVGPLVLVVLWNVLRRRRNH